jgi:potassium efflux system protein
MRLIMSDFMAADGESQFQGRGRWYPHRNHRVVALLAAACLLLCVESLPGQEDATTRSALTPEQIQNRLAAVRESQEIDDAARPQAVELYQQAIANLETTRANRQTTESYRNTAGTAPEQVEAIRASMERRRDVDPVTALGITPAVGLEKLEQDLESELANLSAIEANLAALETDLETETRRPAQVRERIAEARLLVEETSGAEALRPPAAQGPFLSEAARWSAETRVEALRSEIAMLDEELLSNGVRIELLQAQRDEMAQKARRAGLRAEALRAAVTERRRDQVEQVMAQAQAVLEDSAGREPVLADLARANLLLVELLRLQVEEIDAVSVPERKLRPLLPRLTEVFRSTRLKLDLEDSGAPIGRAIREQRQQLPSVQEYRLQRNQLQRSITAISLRLVENEGERRSLADLNAYLEDHTGGDSGIALGPELRAEFQTLAETRRMLLTRAISNDRAELRRLHVLDDLLQQLKDITSDYDQFLAKHLLWVKSAPAVSLTAFKTLPGELAALLDTRVWIEASHDLWRGMVRGPWLLALILLAGLLLARRQSLRGALLDCGRDVGSIRRDRMTFTWRAVALTLLLAVPGTLLLAALGWALTGADTTAALSGDLADALLKTSILLLLVNSLFKLSLPGGLAERHFEWNTATVAELHRELAWFRGLGVPLYLLSGIAVALDPSHDGGTLGMLTFIAYLLGLLALTARLLHPARGVIRQCLCQHRNSVWWRWRYLWFSIAVAIPLSMMVAQISGYTYTAGELMVRWTLSVWLLTGAWLGGELVRRWLLVTRRRLAFEAAMKERDAARAQRAGDEEAETADQEATDNDIGAPEVDLIALDADSRQVVNAILLLLAALGLAAIWDDMLPAFKVLNEVTLWSTAFKIEGEDVLVWITLADALVALLIGIVGYVLANNFPSLIDIILLKRGKVSAGARYALTTVTKYGIVIVATLLVLGQLGASWSQLGWAAAALGVGIGFGLQEIVANFISGLILLAERPVRVGDLITVGDASGKVERIRIRATTIRDFEQKELLIPNKELITGRLLNWTLSDARTRILIQVGIAYGSDVDRAIEILQEFAHEDERVLDDPAPGVVFDQFGDSSLNLGFRVFVGTLEDRLPVMTDMHRKIHRRFAEESIVIAFPQRDVHLYAKDHER